MIQYGSAPPPREETQYKLEKEKMQDWLKIKNIAYGEGDTIPQLFLKGLDSLKVFEIEQATEEYHKKSKSIVNLQFKGGGGGGGG